jgi:hypothetical protein
MSFAIVGITAGVGAAVSGGLAIDANKRRKRRERELDEMAKSSPLYQGSKPISEYYQTAMNRYKENPYQSQQYQVGARNIQRSTAQGLSALQDRRSALGGISRLAQGQADALTNLGVNAEGQRNARFGQLGSATQMKNADLAKQFEINQQDPYLRKFGIQQMKVQAANQEYANAVQGVQQNISNVASAATGYKKGT